MIQINHSKHNNSNFTIFTNTNFYLNEFHFMRKFFSRQKKSNFILMIYFCLKNVCMYLCTVNQKCINCTINPQSPSIKHEEYIVKEHASLIFCIMKDLMILNLCLQYFLYTECKKFLDPWTISALLKMTNRTQIITG